MSQNMNNQTADSTHNVIKRKFSNAREKYRSIRRKKNNETLEIGTPSSFSHVIGVKSSTKGFQMVGDTDAIDPLLRAFLHVAGLSVSILSNPKQKHEIYKFVEDKNVLGNIRVTIDQHKKRETKMMKLSKKPKVAPKPSIKVKTTPSILPPPRH